MSTDKVNIKDSAMLSDKLVLQIFLYKMPFQNTEQEENRKRDRMVRLTGRLHDYVLEVDVTIPC